MITAIAGGLAAGPAQAGSGEVQRAWSHPKIGEPVIVKRSPNIGYQQHFNLYIDGVRVATLGYGRQYEGFVPAGVHLVKIKQMPHLNDAWPYSEQWIRIVPGRTNVFTAAWRDGGTRIRLVES
jgi:hypothetical protein